MRTYTIGHSRSVDIILPHRSVGAHHAELVVTGMGEYHLTDCGSGCGTWVQALEEAGDWRQLRQGFVQAHQPLRFGTYECTVGDLLETPNQGAGTAAITARVPKPGRARSMPTGTVERDPLTGEIVRKRL